MAKSEAEMLKEERERMSNDLATKGQELKNAMKDKMSGGDDGEDLTKEAVYTEHQMTVEECAELLGTKCSEEEKVGPVERFCSVAGAACAGLHCTVPEVFAAAEPRGFPTHYI